MISGDSTASHMGSVKNIEKARERRTFETMPGSSKTGVPDDLLQHAETVHPRMGYDMSDSIFMQEMQAAERQKESKKALEERSALEAFRAAAIQKPFDQPAPALSGRKSSFDRGREEKNEEIGDDGGKKAGSPSPPPIAGIKIRKKKKKALVDGSTSSREGSAHSDGRGEKRRSRGEDSNIRKKGCTTKGDKPASSSVNLAGSVAGVGSKHAAVDVPGEVGSGNDRRDTGRAGGAGLGLGLVAYSSGEDED